MKVKKLSSIQSKLITPVKERFFTSVNCEKGYALPVVLVVSLVIITLTLAISFSLRSKISIATELKDHAQATLQTYSAVNEVFYRILTSPVSPTGLSFPATATSPGGDWTFYGEPFNLSSGVTVKLKDLSGTLSLPFGGERLHRLLANITGSRTKADSFYFSLVDWQDADDLKHLNGAEAYEYAADGQRPPPRNFYLQTIDEAKLIKGYDPAIFEQLMPDLTYWTSGRINPLLMSENLLRVLINNDATVDQILSLRKEGNLSAAAFGKLTGFADTGSNYYWPSGWIKVVIRSQVGRTIDTLETVIVKRQSAQKPFYIIEWLR